MWALPARPLHPQTPCPMGGSHTALKSSHTERLAAPAGSWSRQDADVGAPGAWGLPCTTTQRPMQPQPLPFPAPRGRCLQRIPPLRPLPVPHLWLPPQPRGPLPTDHSDSPPPRTFFYLRWPQPRTPQLGVSWATPKAASAACWRGLVSPLGNLKGRQDWALEGLEKTWASARLCGRGRCIYL